MKFLKVEYLIKYGGGDQTNNSGEQWRGLGMVVKSEQLSVLTVVFSFVRR